MSDTKLKRYHSKRDFSITPEPKGRVLKKQKKPIFVIHKHAARALHYDVRLEDEGVLKSWAVPKGPSEDPHDKRLAIQTEDHPYDYAKFHGTIPKGNYGAGEVEIWDHGTFDNMRSISVTESIKEGKVEVIFHGKKIKGAYALIRTHLSENSWLFFKMHQGPALDPSNS